MINHITSRYKHGEEFDTWLGDIKKNREKTIKKLYDYCKVIHVLDRDAGKELQFDEALKIVMERPDTSANIDDVIWLQRNINGINYDTEEIIIWDETCKWVGSRCSNKSQIVGNLRSGSFNSRRLPDIVNYIRLNPESFEEWHQSETTTLSQVLLKFADCGEYVTGINLHEKY